MHEGSIVREILEMTSRIRLENALQSVDTVRIEVGRMHHLVPEVMQTYFEGMRTEYQGLENAVMVIETRPLQVKCGLCGDVFEPEGPIFMCEKCQHFDNEVISGDQLNILAVEGI